MAEKHVQSEYLRYLPLILWEQMTAEPESFLGRFLHIFEKILTGVQDDHEPLRVIRNGRPREYPSFEEIIDGLYRQFDPNTTDSAMLPWLASWLALALREDWNELQRRAIIGTATTIYQQRGLKQGLLTYLGLYAATDFRPRIAIDDGEALLRVPVSDQGPCQACPFAFPRLMDNPLLDVSVASKHENQIPFLLHPTAVAVARTGSAFQIVVADAGLAEFEWKDRHGSIWRLSETGEPLDWMSPPPPSPSRIPQPVNHVDFEKPFATGADPPNLRCPVAVAIDEQGRILVLDQGFAGDANPDAGLYRYTLQSTGKFNRELLIRNANLKAVVPLDMAYDGATQRVFILDRGAPPGMPFPPPPAVPPQPQLITFTITGSTASPAVVAKLNNLVEPTAMVLDPGMANRIVVADARKQNVEYDPHDPEWKAPFPDEVRRAMVGDLLRVQFDPANPGQSLTCESLLKPGEATSPFPAKTNPLIFPTGLYADPEHPQTYYVADCGLKSPLPTVPDPGIPKSGDPYNRWMAEPAQVYRVDLLQKTISRVISGPGLVLPGKLAVDPLGSIIIANRGEELYPSKVLRDWRAVPHSFSVLVHFSAERPTNASERRVVYSGVTSVIDAERPAHTTWTFWNLNI